MTGTERQIAEYAHHWLASSDGGRESMWIVVESENPSVGLDIAQRMTREALGRHRQIEIPYDNLPVCAGVNPETGRVVWILSQPNHVPTIQVSMQGVVGDLIERDASVDEQRIISASADLTLPEVTDSPVGVYADRNRVQAKAPVELMVHQEDPMWTELVQYITEDTMVRMTDKVRRGPPQESPSEDPDRTLDKYDPDSE